MLEKEVANILAIKELHAKIESGGKVYMNCKEDYKAYFAEVSKFLKMSYFCKLCGIQQQHLSTFVKTDYLAIMSLDKCVKLYNCIQENAKI